MGTEFHGRKNQRIFQQDILQSKMREQFFRMFMVAEMDVTQSINIYLLVWVGGLGF